MAPPGMPNTTSTPSRSSAATSAWAPVIRTGPPPGGSSSVRRGVAPGAACRPAASRAGARAARSRGDGTWPWRAGPVCPAWEPTVVVVWSVIAMLHHLRWLRERWQQKTPLALRQSGWRADYRTSEIRAPGKYENVATVHVVHCGPWGWIRQPESSFVSECETERQDGFALLMPRRVAATRRLPPDQAPGRRRRPVRR